MIPNVTLNNGAVMPILGYGVFKVSPAQAAQCVQTAIEAGYRSIDTAAAYQNETQVGEGIRRSSIARDQLFVTTKLWNSDQGYDAALRAFDASISRLGLNYIDLYLIHWPIPHSGLFVETWKALEKLYQNGRVRAIGVSNFTASHLKTLQDECGIVPAVNQIELHPWLPQQQLCAYMQKLGIAAEAWSPLAQGGLLTHPVLKGIARGHGKTTAQVILRWHIQCGIIVIPKSVHKERMISNADIFDFTLSEDDMSAIGGIAQDKRVGPHPDTFHMDAPR